MNTIVVVGNDRICRGLVARLSRSRRHYILLIDKSMTLQRVWRVLSRGRLRLRDFVRMAVAELMRANPEIPQSLEFSSIRNNADLLEQILIHQATTVYLFRAGLIINKSILERDVEVLNLHCAKIPEYGGLAAIARALRDKAYEQFATLHRVTEAIDRGEVVRQIPYRLSPTLSYRENEDLAYETGIQLLLDELSR